nr:4657_t:CDS:2 [Entrophospora candida]
MKIFLTGGSGYLGRNFIEYALSENDQIKINVLSRSSVSDEYIVKASEKVSNGDGRVKIIRGGIENIDVLKEGVNEADIIVHMAAKVNNWGYYEEFEKINVQGTLNLLNAIESLNSNNTKSRRFVLISSFTAKLNNHYPNDSLPDWAPYSKSKCLKEQTVINKISAFSSINEIIILRLGWIWGKDDTSLLPKLNDLSKNPLWKITPTTPIRIYEIKDDTEDITMEEFIDFYVGTAYDIIPPKPFNSFRFSKGLVFNIVGFIENIPFLNYAKSWVIGSICRESLVCIFKPYNLDNSKASSELGYVGKISREEGLIELKKYMKN